MHGLSQMHAPIQQLMTEQELDDLALIYAREDFGLFRRAIRPNMIWGWWTQEVAWQLQSTPLERPHYLYGLGPAIKPGRPVPTNGNGNSIWGSGRRWIFIDLLLTAGSVAEADYLTKQRLASADQDTSALEQTEGRRD
jgi:hypothetical protein